MAEQIQELTIRDAGPGDADAIATVHVRSWQEAYAGIVSSDYLASLDAAAWARQWEHHLRHAEDDEIRTWIAQDGTRTLGFASLGPSRDEDARRGDLEVYSIYLEPGAWGHGVAREIMRTLIGEAGEQTTVTLWVLAANERARHFYRRHGFQADGVERYEQVGGEELLEVRFRRG